MGFLKLIEENPESCRSRHPAMASLGTEKMPILCRRRWKVRPNIQAPDKGRNRIMSNHRKAGRNFPPRPALLILGTESGPGDFRRIDLHARAHRRADRHFLDELALG